MRKWKAQLLLILFSVASLYAGGNKESDEKLLEKQESWQEEFSLEEKKAGKYNFVITAEDQGGNVTVAGPYNVWIDPDSDLPVTGITNPSMNMRVPGNLNIVGTCVDDDAVKYIELILDDDADHPIRAEGKEFWSYFLDTTGLAEGKHSVEAYGVDVNGLRGESVRTEWHLDRNQPLTEVSSHNLGMLVSGKVKFSGLISDGNGIKSLSYFLNDDEEVTPLKVSYAKKTQEYSFNLTIDTRKLSDGPQVCWFKAVDNQGTEGISSFLFFVDNTNPEIAVYSPAEDESVNGLFTIAGSVYDEMGLTSLTWQLGKEAGEFTLTDGNPYWKLDCNILGQTAKKQSLVITATDKAGNVAVLKRTLSVDLEADLPVVTLQSPEYDGSKTGPVIGDELFLRGSIADDDGVAELHWSIDKNGDDHVLATEGVFYTDILNQLSEPLSAGVHTLNVYAVDIHGTAGKTVTVPFTAEGAAPAFGDTTVKNKAGAGITAGEASYELGMSVHPETAPTLNGTVESGCGLVSIKWQFNGQDAGEVDAKSKKGSSAFSIPLSEAPWGTVHVTVIATDIYERETRADYFLYQTNLTKVRADEAVVFSDSGIAEDGTVCLEKGESVSGYVTGGTASSVELEPDEGFVSAALSGNSILLTATGKTGVSSPVTVKVTTDRTDSFGNPVVYSSKPLTFKVPDTAPLFKMKTTGVQDGFKNVTVEGSLTGQNSFSAVKADYRVLSAESVKAAAADPEASKELPGWKTLSVDESGAFSLELNASSFSEGIYIVELRAVNGTSAQSVAAVPVKKVSPLEMPDLEADPKAKIPVAAAPSFVWIEGEQLYYTSYYQDDLTFTSLTAAGAELTNGGDGVMAFAEAGAVPYSLLPAGSSSVEVKVTDAKAKVVSSKKTLSRDTDVTVRFDSVDGDRYLSGMIVELPPPGSKEQTGSLRVVIHSGLAVSGVSYTKTVNGTVSAPAKLSVKRIAAADGTLTDEYEAFIPLKDMEAEITTFAVTATVGKTQTADASGTISVVRAAPEAGLADAEKVYWTNDVPEYKGAYLLQNGKELTGYVNVKSPFQADIVENGEGLSLRKSGSFIYLTTTADGLYENTVIRITDREGVEYLQPAVSVLSDSAAPSAVIVSPDEQAWLQNSMTLKVQASDANGLSSVEYSVNNGQRWSSMTLAEGAVDEYVAEVSLASCEEGFVPLDVRVTDTAGCTTLIRRSVFKDVTPPEIVTIVPAPGDVINGETLFSMKVTDNGKIVSGFYQLEKEDLSYTQPLTFTPFASTTVGTHDQPLDSDMSFIITDAAGNVLQYTQKTYVIDQESDKPVVIIQLPEELSVETTDFTVSGTVVDDDGDSTIWYKIDDGEYRKLPEAGTSWSVSIPGGSLSDNEHTITVYAVDQFGIQGNETSRTFRISNEEPEGSFLLPSFEETVNGRISITGTTWDENGIDKVLISIDNGNTWNQVVGTEEWSYEFDTRVVEDGTHLVFIKVWDNYGIESLYSSLINIDNTAPEISLELPRDNSDITTGKMILSGQTTDNISLEKLYVQIRSLDGTVSVPSAFERLELDTGSVISKELDISSLEDGLYNIEISGEDKAGNITRIARNFTVDSTGTGAELNLLYPMNGDTLHGNFNVYGEVISEYDIKHVSLIWDERELAAADVSETHYVKFPITPDMLSDGSHSYYLRTTLDNGTVVRSEAQTVTYEAVGLWITIDSITMGDYAINRPFMSGSAGFQLSEEDELALESKETPRAEKNRIKALKVGSVEISFDNGKTFEKISSKGNWQYRIENTEFAEGMHYVIVKATMASGETVATRCIFQIDKTAPVVKLFSPNETGRYNQSMDFSGIATDDTSLKSVTLNLRSGDRSSYEVPSFIQGLYLDGHVFGVSFYDVGLGLTFFDENVKLQFQYGSMTQEQFDLLHDLRGFEHEPLHYGGDIFGIKLLANLGKLPFSYFMGPGANWLSATFAIGANFSMFSQTQSGKPQILSALIGQIEFPKASFEKRTFLTSVSSYVEFQLWSIPSDVQYDPETDVKSLMYQLSSGIRVSLF
ncbi:MAG: hypothetical protein KBT02_06325 [Treponema sp.]|nr:hypothetical protein [Candidatus Treponema caballi]